MEGLTLDTWVGQAGLLDADAGAQYVAAVYWSFTTITTVGIADIEAATPLEYTFLNIWMICGVLIYSFIIANLSLTLSNLDKKNDALTVFWGFVKVINFLYRIKLKHSRDLQVMPIFQHFYDKIFKDFSSIFYIGNSINSNN